MLRRAARSSLSAQSLRNAVRIAKRPLSTKLQVVKTVEETRQLTQKLRRQGKTIAFVPTMVRLHAGAHLLSAVPEF